MARTPGASRLLNLHDKARTGVVAPVFPAQPWHQRRSWAMCLPHAFPRRRHVRSDKRTCRAEAILFATAVTSRMRAADG
jgi:hypothetical protein